MKTDSEQALPMDVAAVWADEPKLAASKRGSLTGFWMLLLAGLVTAFGVGITAWFYTDHVQTLRSLSAHIQDGPAGAGHSAVNRLTEEADKLALAAALNSAGATLALFFVFLLSSRWWSRRYHTECGRIGSESGSKIQRLQMQLADLTISSEEAQRVRTEAERRLKELSQSHTHLQSELSERKLMERSLAQQTQQLERSKDVLEMHVQARTQELQKLQRRNELILNSAGEGICGFDLQGKVTFANPAAARLTGWRIEDMTGRTEEELFFPLKPRNSREPSLRKDAKGDFLPQQEFQRRDGVRFAVEDVRTSIREGERTVGAVVMFKDITERKLAEEKLAHKADELARSNAELEQFAYVASHDLQEPLRKIQAFGDRLKIKCEAVQLEEGRDYLDRMQSASARMQTLINDLLTFSRVMSSSQPFVPVDLALVTKEVLVDLEHRIEKTKAEVSLGKLPTIDADPLQMRQLLQNLISNALKFQPANSSPVVKIDAQMVTRDQIKEEAIFANPPPSARHDDRFCVLTVQDNGIGFEEQYLEKIFAVFQRLHGRSEYEGTGVGLAVCRRITDRHGGLITAQSKPSEGATFIVVLPMRQPKPEVES